MSLQLPAQTFQLAASQDGLAVLIPEIVFVLDQLVLLLLQCSHLFLGVTVLFQLSQRQRQRTQRLTKTIYNSLGITRHHVYI